jgi:hypothetical protein
MKTTKRQLRRIIKEEQQDWRVNQMVDSLVAHLDNPNVVDMDSDEVTDWLVKQYDLPKNPPPYGLIDLVLQHSKLDPYWNPLEGLYSAPTTMMELKTKVTKRQLRRIIKESIDVINASSGEIMTFADKDDKSTDASGIPQADWATAPEAAARDIIKRLNLTPLEGYSDGVQDAEEEIWLSAEDWAEMDHEIVGKRFTRKAKKARKRLDIDNLMTRLEDWALNAREEYAADNPGADMQGIAWDLAQGAEYSFESDEWDALLNAGPFDYPDDLYTYVADLIA